MRRRTLLINATLLVGVVIVGVVSYESVGTAATKSATAQTVTVTQGTVTATVSASGNVTSANYLGVSFSSCTGNLTSVAVAPGAAVTVGQTLATVDPTNAQTAVNTAQTAVNDAQAARTSAIAAAQTSYDNARTTQADDAITTTTTTQGGQQTSQPESQATKDRDAQQVAAALTALNQAKASTSQSAQAVVTAQTNLANAEATLASCTLTSPIAGTVITVNGAVGATPGSASISSTSSSSSASSGTGSTGTGASGTGSNASSSSSSSASASAGVSTSGGFITIADMTQLIMPSTVTESDIGSVKAGDAVSVIFSALTDANNPNGTTVAGTLSSVALTSTVSSSVVSYGVTISLTAPPANLRLGQTGTATITTASKADVLRVTSSAITTTGRGKTVTVKSGNTDQIVTVTTGITGNGFTEITSGLTAGQVLQLPTTTSTSTSTLLGGGGGTLGGTR